MTRYGHSATVLAVLAVLAAALPDMWAEIHADHPEAMTEETRP